MPCVENLTSVPRVFGRAPDQVVLEPGLNYVPADKYELLRSQTRFQLMERAGLIKVYDDDEFDRRVVRIARGELALDSRPVPEQVKIIMRITDPELLRSLAKNTRSLVALRACLARLRTLRG